MRVMISSAGTATSIGLIKSFRSLNPSSYIVAVDINPYGYTAGSQLADRFHQVHYASDDCYIEEIASIIRDEMVDLFIPINDIEVDVISHHRSDLPSFCKYLVPDAKTVELCRDKLLATRHVESLGIRCPELLEASSAGPRICRERVSVGSKGIIVYEEKEPLTEDALTGMSNGQSFLQRRVNGREYTVDVLSDDRGKPIYVIPRERAEVKAGVATKTVIVNNDEMIEAATKIVQSLIMPGFSNVQFIMSQDDEPFFIEINPRFGGCSIASLLAAPDMFPTFVSIAKDGCVGARELNQNVKWNSVVTRYYEEVLYEQ